MENNISRRKFISSAGLTIPVYMAISNTSFAAIIKKFKTKDSGMKVGVDEDKLYAVKDKGPFAVLDYVKEQGFDGVFYRTMLDLSPTLDLVKLQEIKAHADSLDLYLDSGAGWVNPYNTAETPHIRRFGNGDYKLAMEMMIKAASKIKCKELYAVSGHSIHGDPFFVAYDRFRTDVSWSDQLLAMKKFINMLKPTLKDTGCRLNLETHGDETSFELLQLIDELGEDILGVTLDTGNLPLSADVPMDAIKRLAPYVHMTHCKDGILYITEQGIVQQLRSVGEGVVNWGEAIEILGKYSPDLHLSFEDYRAENLMPFYDPEWRGHFPDLTDEDIIEFERLAKDCEDKIKNGKIMGIEEYRELPFSDDDRIKSYKKGAAYLKKIIIEKGLN